MKHARFYVRGHIVTSIGLWVRAKPWPDPLSGIQQCNHKYILRHIVIKNHTASGRLAQPCQSLAGGKVDGSSPVRAITKILHNQTFKPIPGCHVAACDWAMWHLYIQPMHAICQPMIHPCQPSRICRVSIADSPTSFTTCQLCHAIVQLPCQLLTSSMPRVTLLVVTHVTFGLA